jgi:hypothetical protein
VDAYLVHHEGLDHLRGQVLKHGVGLAAELDAVDHVAITRPLEDG